MAPKSVYSIDSSALIHAWRRVYRPKNFGFVWNGFDSLIEESRLRCSIEVYNELEKKDDELFKWCKDRKEGLFVGSCPLAWCNWRRVTAIAGKAGPGIQPASAGRLTAGSSLKGAMVSSVM